MLEKTLNSKLDAKLTSKIVIITGKGGVGKSRLSASLAAKEAKKGKRVLLAELGEKSYFQPYFSKVSISYEPKKLSDISDNLYVSLWGGIDALKDYVEEVVKLKSLVNLFFSNPVMRSFADAAPALSDISILGKMTSGVRQIGKKMDFDLIVVDAYSTGHFLSMLRTPTSLYQAMSFGPMGSQCKEIMEVLSDPKFCSYIVPVLPEELPVREGLELCDGIREIVGGNPLLILNQVLAPEIVAKKPLEVPERVKNEVPEFVKYVQEIKGKEVLAREQLKNSSYEFVVFPRIFMNEFLHSEEELLEKRAHGG